MGTHTHFYIYKYNLLNLYNVTFVHILEADYLALDNQLVRSSLGKTIFPTLIIPLLPVVFCVRLRSCRLTNAVYLSVGVLTVQLVFT